MEAFYNSNAWLSTADALRGAGHDQQQSPPPTVAQNGVEWSKPGDIDLSDFGLGDLQASNASPTSTPSMQHMYQFPPNGYFTTMAPFNMIPYGQAASTSSWPQQNLPLSSYSTLNGATSSIGTSQPQQPHQQHSPSQPPSTQQSAIDPSLTSTTNSASYSPPPSASSQGSQQSSSLQFSIPFHHQQQQQQQQQHHPHQNMHSPVLAMSPVYLMQQQAQQQQQQQRTLNPQQLTLQYPFTMYSMQQHAQSPMQTNLTATTSHSATPPPASSSNSLNPTIAPQSVSAPAPELDPVVFKRTVDQLLSPSGLSNAYTVRRLMDAVAEMGSARVTPEMRMDIASRIRDNAGNAFFAAWARDDEAMVLLVGWLKAGVTGKDEGKWECTIMPLLHVLDRLPLTISLLREHRLGKLTTALLKSDTVSPAIKDMASNISNKWRNLIEPSSGSSAKEKDSLSSKKVPEIEDKTKKRKLGDAAPKPPSKVAVVSSGTSTTGTNKPMKVKKEKVVVTAVKDAKVDSSFFSTPKPKPKLPSFKKAPVTSTTSAGSGGSNTVADVAQPNNDNPFQQALKEMKGRAAVAIAASPALNKLDGVNGDINALVKPSTPDLVIKNGKKRKSVSWAPEGHLEKVRVIERAVYDDDHVNEMYGAHSIRDLERAEGAAMHIHLFEEAIDWYEPNDLEFPQDIDSTERGAQSEEKVIQEEREKITLGALYFADSDIPETPGEPATQIPFDQVDSEARTMVAGADIEPFFQYAMSVSDLVGQLRASTSAPPLPAAGYGSIENVPQGEDVTMSNVNNAFGVSGGFDLSKLDPNALSSLAVSLGLTGFNFGAGAGAAVPDVNNSYSSQNVSSAWGAGMYNQQPQSSQQSASSASYSDSNYAYDERDRDDRNAGRGGFRGRGRGGSAGFRGGRGGGAGGYGGDFKYKKRCNFYAQGSCRYGDQCHFLHELD